MRAPLAGAFCIGQAQDLEAGHVAFGFESPQFRAAVKLAADTLRDIGVNRDIALQHDPG